MGVQLYGGRKIKFIIDESKVYAITKFSTLQLCPQSRKQQNQIPHVIESIENGQVYKLDHFLEIGNSIKIVSTGRRFDLENVNRIDVVIPYEETGSQEILYSIRSLSNLVNFNGKIHIISSTNPNISDTNWIPFKGKTNSPYKNVLEKIKLAANSKEVSEDFILSNDDFFVMRRTTINHYHRGSLDNHIRERQVDDAYTRALKQTNDILVRNRVRQPRSYELHIPMILNKSNINLIFDLVTLDNNPVLIRSLYGNYYQNQSAMKKDVKNPENYRGSIFLSTSDKSFKSENIGKYIRAALDIQ